MARRTKAEALQTRSNLLDAAERLFLQNGVSRTSLAQIAEAAGATRGAIYWHFKDKADLFIAMMERVTLPLEEDLEQASAPSLTDGLGMILRLILKGIDKATQDLHARQLFEIATQKVEYVEELNAVKERRLQVRQQMIAATERALEHEASRQGVQLPMPAHAAAVSLYALVDGLMMNWLLVPQTFDLAQIGRSSTYHFVRSLGLQVATQD
ncbi:MAG TPA: TetR family transcriptional regulator [Macromonas sp.]|nr:TetR family transcriptional regulator [Macromonas sp.]